MDFVKNIDKHGLIVFFISLIAFFPILNNEFTYYSDDVYVLNNPLIQKLSLSNIGFIFSSFFDGHYHPLTLLTFSVNYFISGDSAFGYQLFNLLINALNSILVYVLVSKLVKDKSIAFFAALLFAVHPLHVESVARITERKDTLYAFFFILSCIYYINYLESSNKKKLIYTCVFFILSLLSKGQAVTLPITLILIGWYHSGLKPIQKHYLFFVCAFLCSTLFGYLNIVAQQQTGYFLDTSSIPFINYFTSAGYTLTHYVIKLFAPFLLSPHYPYPYNIYETSPYFYLLYLLVFPLILLAIFWARKNKLLLFGLLFYLLNIFLMIRFIPVSENIMADRYNYIPIIGFTVFFVLIIQKVVGKNMQYVMYVVLSLFFIKTITQTKVWHDGTSVWLNAYNYAPNDSEINLNLGVNYLKSKNFSKAESHLNKSVSLDEENLLAKIRLSDYLWSVQKYSDAYNEMQEVVNYQANLSKDLSNQSSTLVKMGEYDKAIVKINEAIQHQSVNSKLYFNKAVILFFQEKYAEALTTTDICLKFRPSFIGEVLMLRTKLYLHLYNFEATRIELKKALNYINENEEIDKVRFAMSKLESYYPLLNTSTDAKQMNSIGLEFFNLGYYSLSSMYFKKAILLSEDYKAPYQNLVYSNYMKQDWYSTVDTYRVAIGKSVEIDNQVYQALKNYRIKGIE